MNTQTSKNKQNKSERRRQQRQRRLIFTLAALTGIALLVAGGFVLLDRASQNQIVTPEAVERPQVDGRTMGDPNAPVIMEVFEDFQCPACLSFTETVEPQIIENYIKTGKVYFVFKNYAFIGPESQQAAEAALCAMDQGRFWDYHDTLFANQTGENIGAFSARRLELFAEQLDLDMNAFNTCVDSNDYLEVISDEFNEGREKNIPGTPGVYINGQLLSSFSYPTVSLAIESALAGQ